MQQSYIQDRPQRYGVTNYAQQMSWQPNQETSSQRRQYDHSPNVDTLERQIAVTLGGGLVLYALIGRSNGLSSLFTGALGAALIVHGQSQRSPFYSALNMDTAQSSSNGQTWNRGEIATPHAIPSNTIEIQRAVTVDKPAGELYNYWRKLENLPNFMKHLKEVQESSGGQSHWVAELAGGLPVSWDAEIVEDVPGERIVWRTLADSTVEQQGKVEFKPASGEQGTVVHVDIRYSPPGGIVGETFAQLLNGVTAQQVKDDIRRFKSLMETGEIPTVEGQPSGRS